MTLGGLFSGIGGFELAAQWAGITPMWSNEIDQKCCKVLRKRFSHDIIEEDIRNIGRHNLQPVDIICGGFPCQPFSSAGKRNGTSDDRYLWPEMLRIITELQPTWVIGENVAGITSMGKPGLFSVLESQTVGVAEEDLVLPEILQSLEEAGYRFQVFNIPACGYYAEHKRERIWIVAHLSIEDDRKRHRSQEEGQKQKLGNSFGSGITANASGEYMRQEDKRGMGMAGNLLQRSERQGEATGERIKWNDKPDFGLGSATRWWEWETEPVLRREDDGVPGRLDRLKSLGNAIYVPIAYEFLKSINQIT